MARVLAAVEELSNAVSELAAHETAHRRKAIADLREAARAKIADLESVAQKGLARLTSQF